MLFHRPLVVGFIGLIFASHPGRAAEPTHAGIELFEQKIRPVLAKYCYDCHAADAKKIKGGLLLDSKAGMLNGGESGPAVVPGKPEKSYLISALRHEDFEMPPQGKLPPKVVADFVRWVKLGAPDPRTDAHEPGVIQEKIDLEAGRNFWAFQKVKNSAVPVVKDQSWPRDDIDRFVLAKIEAEGFHPVADADRMTLIRRVYYDLIGLPPTPAELQAFLEDTSTDAYEQLVDRMLDSPHFGERWGRHWLDVAHYAESNGNVRNFLFPHAWRYRNWVISAINQDKPYDRFITEQLAGDLLPTDSPAQRNAQKVATGFLALASKPQKGPTLEMDLIAEQIEVATRATMALTVSCARCHDHKFDPIATEDYYAMAGIFASSQMLYGGTGANGSAPKTALHVLEGDDPQAEERFRQHEARIAIIQDRQQEVKQLLRKARGKQKKKEAKRGQSTADNSKTNPSELQKEAKQLSAELKQLKSELDGRAMAMGLQEAAKAKDLPVYFKGESPKGAAIPRGFVRVAMQGEGPVIPAEHSGRLELAQWLTSAEHPLTARVMANRIWHHLFGRGLVRTVDNFGINGERPTHPKLLDHLAVRFVQEGWSMKRMIRAIVLSRTYQLSSDHDQRAYEVDPDNTLLWRRTRRRLDGEAIRDSILAASGQLDRQPAEGSVVASYGDAIIRDKLTVDAFQVESKHRSVYLPIIRNGVPELLNVFDFADPSLVVGRRDVTTVPAQELYLMNSPFVVEQSKHFARALLERSDLEDAERVALAYQRALCRPASKREVDRVLNYLDETSKRLQDRDGETQDRVVASWASFCQALFVSAEFRYVK